MRQKYLVICLLLCANLYIDTVSGGKAFKAIKFLKGGAILAALLPHLLPFPFPLPIPFPIEKDSHHFMPVCDAKPVHIYKHYEFIPYPVRADEDIRAINAVMDNIRNNNNNNNFNNVALNRGNLVNMVNRGNRRPLPLRNDQTSDGNEANPELTEDNSPQESSEYRL